jgi:hypothetical protein
MTKFMPFLSVVSRLRLLGIESDAQEYRLGETEMKVSDD